MLAADLPKHFDKKCYSFGKKYQCKIELLSKTYVIQNIVIEQPVKQNDVDPS